MNHGKTALKKQLKRDPVVEFFVNLPPRLIGMEAWGSAHHRARKLASFGHTVKLIAPQFVKPCMKTRKHEAADADVICEAVARRDVNVAALALANKNARIVWALLARDREFLPDGTPAAASSGWL